MPGGCACPGGACLGSMCAWGACVSGGACPKGPCMPVGGEHVCLGACVACMLPNLILEDTDGQ